MATRRTEAERIAALEAELAAAKSKAEAKAKKAETEALEKAAAKAERIEKQIEKLTKVIDEATEKRAMLSLELEGIEVEVVDTILDSSEATFEELTLEEV
jgi:hypothetical protein